MAVRAVVGGDARVVQQRRRPGRGRRRGSPAAPAPAAPRRQQLVLPDRQRRGAHPAAAEQRAAVVVRVGEAEAERAGDVQAVARLELAQALGARPDVLEHELAGGRRARAQDREGPRQERALVGAPAPPLGRGEHVELPGARRRAVGVLGGEHDVGAERAALGDAAACAGRTAPACAARRASLAGLGRHAAGVELLQREHLRRRPGARPRSRAPRPARRRAWSGTGSRARRRRGGSPSRRCARPSPSAC